MYRESIVDKWLKRCVEEAGGLIMKMHPITNAGVPDRIIHFRGMTFYVELKETGKKCEPLQIEMHKRLKARGIQTYVLDTKITNIWDLFVVAYTTYEGKHYKDDPKNTERKELRAQNLEVQILAEQARIKALKTLPKGRYGSLERELYNLKMKNNAPNATI